MNRFIGFIILSALPIAVANAGQIQIGGTSGLTCAYLASVDPTNCSGGSSGNFVQQSYYTQLGEAPTSGSPGYPQPYAGYNVSGNSAGNTITDSTSGVTFAMMSDGASNGLSNDTWAASYGVGDSVTIPIGIFGVTDVWTMIGNLWGGANANDTTVTFNFDTSATGPGISADQVIVNLTNSGTSGASGQVNDAVQCASGTSTVGNPTFSANCTQFAVGNTAASSAAAVTVGGSSVVGGITVNSNQVYSQAYLAYPYNTSSSDPYDNGQPGTVRLVDQGFLFNTIATSINTQALWLVSMTITDNAGYDSSGLVNGTTPTAGPASSQTFLSAITVDTPEPASVFLLLGGIGSLLVAKRRLKT